MTLFSSLYTGVGGMTAQSKSTANISTNIANMTTIGYKKSDTVFHDLVVNNTRPARFANGAVMSDRVHRIDRQGSMQQGSSLTEIAISGHGFFPVKAAANAGEEMLYTRNGTFAQDREGLLRNSAGFVLYGWPVDANGVPVTGNSLTSLVPVDINTLDTLPIPTTQAEQHIILDASEAPYDPHLLGGSLPASNEAAHFVRSQTVFDATGVERQLNFEYRKIVGPMAHFTSDTGSILQTTDTIIDPLGPTPGINPGDTLTINSGGGGNVTITFVNGPADLSLNQASTIGEMLQLINSANGSSTFSAHIGENGRLLVRAKDPAANLNLSLSSASVTGANGFNFVDDPGTPQPYIYDPETPLAGGGIYPGQADLPAFANTADPNPYGWWELTVTMADPADPSNPALPPVTLRQGLINFNADGSLNAAPGADGNITLNLTAIEFDNALTGEEIDVAVDISGYSQFSSNYTAIKLTQNGAAPGTLTDVVIDDLGHVVGKFSNGTSQILYQVGVVDFINPNGLQKRTGTVFAQTQDAGDLSINVAGTGGAGSILTSTIENSNVDLADEFANLIVSQRAFQANSKVVNTVDEMTQLLRQIKG